eukprot:2055524-Pleurochrysis_carterae.AAC.1
MQDLSFAASALMIEQAGASRRSLLRNNTFSPSLREFEQDACFRADVEFVPLLVEVERRHVADAADAPADTRDALARHDIGHVDRTRWQQRRAAAADGASTEPVGGDGAGASVGVGVDVVCRLAVGDDVVLRAGHEDVVGARVGVEEPVVVEARDHLAAEVAHRHRPILEGEEELVLEQEDESRRRDVLCVCKESRRRLKGE